MVDKSEYILPNDIPVCLLDCSQAFKDLSEKEKLYSHYLSQASFCGGLICLLQALCVRIMEYNGIPMFVPYLFPNISIAVNTYTSPESPGIYLLLQKLFRAQPITELQKAAQETRVSEEEFQALLVYTAGFYANMGNYKSFGDSKFIPNLPKEKFEVILSCSKAVKDDPAGMKALWDRVGDDVYSLSERSKTLGLGEKGITTYFSSNCDFKDAEFAKEFLTAKDLSPYNTRFFKKVDPKTGKVDYEVKLASVETGAGIVPGCGEILGTHHFQAAGAGEPVTVHVTRGDHCKLMKLVMENLTKAKEFAANETERSMVEKYIESFMTGSISAHKDGSRFWIKNKGPIVETYIGFIESYRDPFGARGEFEGFVAVVNKAVSAKFAELVENAEHLLALLPWPAAYEKDKFLRPDFTSLDVLSFGGSGIPAGINIPNYDDIRQNEGFKNVSLGNVLTAGYKDNNITFLSEEDKELYSKLKVPAFEVQVGLHELLGHGSGKLFIQEEDGKFNFDIENVKHTETGERIKSWYQKNETWDAKFSTIASTYEECRAECVGIFLCLSQDALRIFGFEDDNADDIIYINWLNMARAGLLALEFYSPESFKWRQAHMNARFVILRVMLEAGEGLVTIRKTMHEDGKEDIILTLDRSKIIPVGKPAIGNFLRKLQVYKSTGDFEAGKAMYDRYSDVNDKEEPHFLSLRDIVIARKQPRKMFVQHNTVLEGQTVTLKSYETTPAGLIQSFQERFPNTEIDDIIQELWDRDAEHFPRMH